MMYIQIDFAAANGKTIQSVVSIWGDRVLVSFDDCTFAYLVARQDTVSGAGIISDEPLTACELSMPDLVKAFGGRAAEMRSDSIDRESRRMEAIRKRKEEQDRKLYEELRARFEQ